MKNKKFLFVALAMALALSSCERTTTEGETKEDTVAESITQDHSNQESDTQGDSSEVNSLEEPEEVEPGKVELEEVELEEVEPEHTPEVIVNDPSKFPPVITLSGKETDHFVTADYCYIEGDKFYLLLDKDLDLPGDFADNISKIINALEEKSGLTFMSAGNRKVAFEPIKMSSLVGCNDPWDEFNFGQKVPIYVIVDHDDTAWVSHSMASYTYVNLLGLYSDGICKELGIPKEYYEGYVQYDVIAHELTHVLTQRYASLTDIMTEGSADYFSEETIRSLVPESEAFAKTADHFEFDYHIEQSVTAQNAETLFYNDFEDHYNQTYAYGHLLCAFLAETYGDSFMHDYIVAVQKIGYTYGEEAYGEWPRDPNKRRADEFKKLFGENVFTDFAAYYNTHKK